MQPWSRADWNEFFESGGAECRLCGQLVDDQRFACAVTVHRSWELASVQVSWVHVECLRRAIPGLA